jgi:hypothetical protein
MQRELSDFKAKGEPRSTGGIMAARRSSKYDVPLTKINQKVD